ncbi:MAG: hypothetical protein ACHQAY_22820 [Hyphomicrobiales bacterium]
MLDAIGLEPDLSETIAGARKRLAVGLVPFPNIELRNDPQARQESSLELR